MIFNHGGNESLTERSKAMVYLYNVKLDRVQIVRANLATHMQHVGIGYIIGKVAR